MTHNGLYVPPPQQSKVAIFTRAYDLTGLWYKTAKGFPKLDRYTIGNQVFGLLMEFLVGITKVEYLTPYQKRERLIALSPSLDSVKILIRLAHSLEIVQEQHYIKFEEELNEIGRMLGGWIRSLSNNKHTPVH